MTDIEKIVRKHIEDWFGEAIETMENGDRVKKYLIDPLVKDLSQNSFLVLVAERGKPPSKGS